MAKQEKHDVSEETKAKAKADAVKKYDATTITVLEGVDAVLHAHTGIRLAERRGGKADVTHAAMGGSRRQPRRGYLRAKEPRAAGRHDAPARRIREGQQARL